MTSIYPKEPAVDPNAPPPYEAVQYNPQAPPLSTFFDSNSLAPVVQQPQQQAQMPFGMYPVGTRYPDGKPVPMGMYPTGAMIMPGQGPPMGTHMLITTQSILYGDFPIQCVCPHCRQSIVTRVEKSTGIVPWLICGGILLFGGWLGCCLIPFCIDSLKDTTHYCPNCAVVLGTRRLM